MFHKNLQISEMHKFIYDVLWHLTKFLWIWDIPASGLFSIIRGIMKTEGSEGMQDEAFTELYRKYANYVYSIAMSYLKNPAEAEDVTADVFVRVLESDISFEDDIRARAWLATVVRNRCKNLLRHWMWKKREAEEVMEQIPVSDQSSELHQVMETMMGLPEKYRLPLMLFAVEGYSVKETADILHLNESTVRTRIARARGIIRKETGVEDA